MYSAQTSESLVRIVIADPSWLVRDGIAHLLCEIVPQDTIHCVADGSELHRALRANPTLDLVLLGRDLVGDEEEALFRHVRKLASAAAIGVLGSSFETEAVRKAVYYGAMAVISTNDTRDRVLTALTKVLANEIVLPSPVIESKASTARPEVRARDSLTSREGDVFTLLGEGLSVPLIAVSLRLSPHTVRVYIARIMKKLDLRDRSALIHRAVSSAAPTGRSGDADSRRVRPR